jgi:dihydrofolate reductase
MIELHAIVSCTKSGAMNRKHNIERDVMECERITKDQCVVMDRDTWDILPRKPFKHRTNIVVCDRFPTLWSQDDAIQCDAIVVPTLEKAIDFIKETDNDRGYVIGGPKLLEETINRHECVCVHLTLIGPDKFHGFLDGISFFPIHLLLNDEVWKIEPNKNLYTIVNIKNGYTLKFLRFYRLLQLNTFG